MKKLLASLALGLGLLIGGTAVIAQTSPSAPAPAASAPAAEAAAAPAAAAPAAAPAAAAPAAPAAAAPAAPVPNKGDTAWMTMATALVIFMTLPGLALFYGGLVRSKNMLSVLMQVFCVSALIYVLWVIYGYSLAFGRSHGGVIGGFDFVGLRGLVGFSAL